MTEPRARLQPAAWPGITGAEYLAPERRLTSIGELRPFLRVGALFRANDLITGFSTKDVVRPILLIASPVTPAEDDEVTRGRLVSVSRRMSWKPKFEDAYGTPTPEARWLASLAHNAPQWLYTPSGLLPAFTKAGVFELNIRRPLRVGRLVGTVFIGWLPKPYVDLARVRAGSNLDEPYPPRTSVATDG